MMMQKHSPNNKAIESEDIIAKSLDSLHSNGHFVSGRNPSLAGSEGNDDKSNDAGSSDDESHEHDNTEQENQTTFIDSSNREHFKSLVKKKKKKTVKVKFADSQDDKTGIKLKIRRTNNFNQDENHVIVDNAEQQRKRHLKAKRCKSVSQDGSVKMKLEETSNNGCSDDNLSHKRSKNCSDDESRISIGINTISKGTDVDDVCLGLCQAGTKLSLESVVLMETKSGILIVSVQWRGKTLMGALMESDRFQIGSIEKDSIYRREKMNAMNRRNTKRKSKNLFGKKKRKLTTPPDSVEHGGTENEAGNSDIDYPYICDKESCHMKFTDFQTLRIHIYQKHRAKGEFTRFSSMDCVRTDSLRTSPFLNQKVQQKPSTDLVRTEHHLNGTIVPSSEERNTFSPAYSDISDANEAPVLENEAELKPSIVSVTQPPINLSLCHNPALLAASNQIFSPTAPALQPEVSICSSQPPSLRLHPNHEVRLPHMANYRFPITTDSSSLINGFLPGSPTNHKPQPPINGALSLSSVSNKQISEINVNSIQDLSINGSLNSNNFQKLSHKLSDINSHHKAVPNVLTSHKQSSVNRHQSHSHHHIHSINNTSLSSQNSKHSMSENGIPNHQQPNGVPLSHNYPYLSFSSSVNNQNNKYNFPINHLSHKF